MKIVLGSDGSIELTRGERITRGQNLSRRIYVEWNENESPIDTGQILADNMAVQLCITRPDGEQSGWYSMIKIDAEDKYYYTLQAWDTAVAGISTVQVRWYDIALMETDIRTDICEECGNQELESGRPIYVSDEASFIVDNGKIAQPLNISSENYNNIMMLLTPLQANSLRKYDVKNLPNDVRYNADGEKTAPALYFNFEHEVNELCENGMTYESVLKSGFLIPIVSNNIQTEFFITGDKLYTRRVTAEETTLFVNTMTSENIAKNTSKIEENTSKIEENTSKIEENTNAIAINTDKIQENTNNIKALFNLQLEKSILSYDNAELSKELQITGGTDLAGLKILDNSYTTVNKISGSSVDCKNLIDMDTLLGEWEGGFGISSVTKDEYNNYKFNIKNEELMPSIQINEYSPGTVPGIFFVVSGEISNYYLLSSTPTIVVSGTDATSGADWSGNYTLNIEGGYTPGQSTIQKFTCVFYPSNKNLIKIKFPFSSAISRNVGLYKVEANDRIDALTKIPPYQPYFTGIKNAQLSGIKSVSTNLLNADSMTRENFVKNADGSYTLEKMIYEPNASGFRDGAKSIPLYLPKGTYTFSLVKSDASIPLSINFILKNGTSKNYGIANQLTRTFDEDVVQFQLAINSSDINTPPIGTKINISKLMINAGETLAEYMPYEESTIQLPETLELGEWDYISDGQLVKQTVVEAYDSAKHDSTAGTYNGTKDFVVSTDCSQVAYKSNAETTPMSLDFKYLVWNKGIEYIATPSDESKYTCFDYGAVTVEENDYYVVVGE